MKFEITNAAIVANNLAEKLQASLADASQLESLIILPMIEDAAKLRQRLRDLVNAL